MSRAVLLKTLREYRALIAGLTLSILLFEILFVRVVAEVFQNLDPLRQFMELPLVKDLLQLALGADLQGDLTPTALATMGYAHPFLYAASWVLLLSIATGVIAGEIGRGTADLLLALPVSRVAVYTSTSVVWVLAAVLASVAAPAGLWLGEQVFPLPEPLDFARLWPVMFNLLALNLSIAAFTMLSSSVAVRRGRAVAVVMAVLLTSDVINFLVQFWDEAKVIGFLGFLHYYRPLPIVRSGRPPVGDMAVLLGLGGLCWTVGLWRFSRRDIPSV